MKNENGQALTEYGLILVLVAVGVIATMGAFGSQIKSKITSISAALSGDTQTYTQAVETGKSFAKKSQGLNSQVNTMSGPDAADFNMKSE